MEKAIIDEKDIFEINEQILVNEIKKIIPHRYPFLLVDKVVGYTKGKRLKSIKNVTVNEEFFNGHFPHFPIMPGVLIVEAMAQSAAILFSLSFDMDDSSTVLFMSIESCKFRKPVLPGDTINMYVEFLQIRGKIAKVDCKAFVDNKIVCESVVTAMIGNK